VGSSSTQPYLFEALSLKPEQRKLLDQKASLFHRALNKKRKKVDQLRRSLFELMSDDYPDSKAIETVIVEISRVQEDTQKLVISHMLDFKSMLDKDQQKKFFDLIQETMMMRPEIHYP
jgi:Spy/CpxP family protein refolding chaperone